MKLIDFVCPPLDHLDAFPMKRHTSAWVGEHLSDVYWVHVNADKHSLPTLFRDVSRHPSHGYGSKKRSGPLFAGPSLILSGSSQRSS